MHLVSLIQEYDIKHAYPPRTVVRFEGLLSSLGGMEDAGGWSELR